MGAELTRYVHTRGVGSEDLVGIQLERRAEEGRQERGGSTCAPLHQHTKLDERE
jgi:hypothetical protein